MSTVLVVGGAGGIGSVVIDILLARGRPVITTVLNEAEADIVRTRFDGRVPVDVVDLAEPEDAREKLIALAAARPDLNGVIVCAGVAWFGAVETTPLSVFSRMMQINAVGTVAIYQATLPVLRKNGGRIILISTIAGRVPMAFMPAYSASKFAQEALCDNMRREAARQGVKVSIITPAGGIRTNMVQKQVDGIRQEFESLSDEHKQRYGYLYEGYGKFSKNSLEATAYTPQAVTDVVFEAFDAEQPASRYLAGDGDIVTLMTGMSDHQQDACFDALFADGATFTSSNIREWMARQS
ncbi:SDR family NAD(P)-dependent oxidoreductase [Sphingobium sp.]|uniref:SDR family NAD(P)-dependent oxidoreductase n=1 Tax=Sphingobium sp. TaxID=1912891 RepID=UPI003B3AD859